VNLPAFVIGVAKYPSAVALRPSKTIEAVVKKNLAFCEEKKSKAKLNENK